MGYLVNNGPYVLTSLTLPFKIQIPNVSPGWRLWIDNESSFAMTFQMEGANPMLCPSNYSMQVSINNASPTFTIISIFGSGSASGSSNLFLYAIAPNDPDIADASKTPTSRFPPNPNYGFQVRALNGGVVASSHKSVLTTNAASVATQLDSLDYNNVVFWEDWQWPSGNSFYTQNASGSTGPSGIPYGFSQPGSGADYTAMKFFNPGGSAPRQPATLQGGAGSNTTNVYPPFFPQFPYVMGASAIEMLGYVFGNVSTTIGTNVDSYMIFLLNPMVQIAIHTTGPTLTTTTVDVIATNLSSGSTQTATFTAPVTAPGTSASSSFRLGMKAILNSSGTYDIYISYNVNTNFTFPAKQPYVFVMTLSSATFASVLTSQLWPGFSCKIVVGAGTTTSASGGFQMGLNTARSNGYYPPCLQINIP